MATNHRIITHNSKYSRDDVASVAEFSKQYVAEYDVFEL